MEDTEDCMEVNTETLEKVIAVIRNNINKDAVIEENTDLRRDLEIDSFDALMIMNALDDEYAISIEEDDFKQVNTPGEIVGLLKRKYGVNGH